MLKTWLRRLAVSVFVLSIVVLMGVAAYVLLWHWPQQAGEDLGLTLNPSDQELRHQVQQLQNARVATGAQLFLGLGLLVGVYLTYRRIRATERQADVAQRQEITGRFTQAIEQLANEESLSIRLGGIYALEKIAQDEPEAYFSQFREVLSAFVRETAREPLVDEIGTLAKFPTDLKVALDVLCRNPPPPHVKHKLQVAIDWSEAHLEGARLLGADLEWANLKGVHLEWADLSFANLQSARMEGAHLRFATLQHSELQGADLKEAHLEHTRLFDANLEGAKLGRAHLQDASLLGANLHRAGLASVHYNKGTSFPLGFVVVGDMINVDE